LVPAATVWGAARVKVVIGLLGTLSIKRQIKKPLPSESQMSAWRDEDFQCVSKRLQSM
jgi:hypothetical protein